MKPSLVPTRTRHLLFHSNEARRPLFSLDYSTLSKRPRIITVQTVRPVTSYLNLSPKEKGLHEQVLIALFGNGTLSIAGSRYNLFRGEEVPHHVHQLWHFETQEIRQMVRSSLICSCVQTRSETLCTNIPWLSASMSMQSFGK